MACCYDYDLAVIGGGSGGFGAALAAARRGLRMLLVEPGPILGGTSTLGGVNTWEPGVGGPGFHEVIYRHLAARPSAVGIGRTAKYWESSRPWAFSRIDRSLDYRSSLRRSGLREDDLTRVTFEPDAMAAAMASLLCATGRVDLRPGSRFVGCEAGKSSISSVVVETAGVQQALRPRFVVDATAQLNVCVAAGCRTYLGAEPKSMYGEPGAPEEHADEINGVTLVYRAARKEKPGIDALPEGVPSEPLERVAQINEYPCGDLNVNVLPLMEGIDYYRLAPADARKELEARVRRHWLWLQSTQGFDRYGLVGAFPRVGVREGPRLIGRKVLTECDVRAGCPGQKDADRWIALADHALDTHGRGAGCRALSGPYGIPYECLLPHEFCNLAVACRGASLSHIAASSCRLSRTMMGLGHAAGLAATAAILNGTMLDDVDLPQVRAWLAEDGVALAPDDPRFRSPDEHLPPAGPRTVGEGGIP